MKKIVRKASVVAKHSSVLAGWPKKLMSPGNPLEFKELDAPALLGRLKTNNWSFMVKLCLFTCRKDLEKKTGNLTPILTLFVVVYINGFFTRSRAGCAFLGLASHVSGIKSSWECIVGLIFSKLLPDAMQSMGLWTLKFFLSAPKSIRYLFSAINLLLKWTNMFLERYI